MNRRRFHIPLRKCDFYEGRALCRDARRKLKFRLDPVALQTQWDPSWNESEASTGKQDRSGWHVRFSVSKYRKRHGEWDLVTWESALPSRLNVKVPSDFPQQLEAAKATYHRFGQYSRALDQMRLLLQHRTWRRQSWHKCVPGCTFPMILMSHKSAGAPDYDPFFYRQLGPEHAAFICFGMNTSSMLRKPWSSKSLNLATRHTSLPSPGAWTASLYFTPGSLKDDVRQNRDNAAEAFGLSGRVIHGTTARACAQGSQDAHP